MIAELRDDDVRQQAGSGEAAFDGTRGRGGLDDPITTRAGELRTHLADHSGALGDVLQLLRDIFAELAQLAAAVAGARSTTTGRRRQRSFPGYDLPASDFIKLAIGLARIAVVRTGPRGHLQ
jgi:hypothetical protein